jgi:hypothetical protein
MIAWALRAVANEILQSGMLSFLQVRVSFVDTLAARQQETRPYVVLPMYVCSREIPTQVTIYTVEALRVQSARQQRGVYSWARIAQVSI